MGNENEPINNSHEYRNLLIDAERKAQEDYDKTVITLSGGALGISFAFIKDIVGDNPIVYSCLLLSAWITWGASLLFMLTSFFLSRRAFRKAITEVDKGEIKEQYGGIYSVLTEIANIAGGILFLAGVILIVIFAGKNMR